MRSRAFGVMVCSLILCSLMNAADARVTIKTSAAILMAGGYMRVTCRVPRHPDNRRITIGLTNYRESQKDLEGGNSAITHEIGYSHVPCAVTAAYCAVTDNSGRSEVAKQSITMAGCDNDQ